MEKPELTMEDIVTAINSCEDDFLLVISFGEEEVSNGKEESLQT